MQRKWTVLLLVLVLIAAATAGFAAPKLRVVLYVNGTLGDKSFFDSANAGLQKAAKELGVFTKVVEGGYDSARWEPDIMQLSEGDWDIIIAGTWQLQEILEKLAPKNPKKKYITYDTSVDYSKPGLGNVYSILYKQNEGSFLVGALAAIVTKSKMPLANPQKVVGFLGGMDIPVINDFKVGYEQGVKYIDKDVKVLVSYVGNFSDSAKGKELMMAQYDQGADIGFNVAGQAGLGLLDAAYDKKRYAIGVDSDQYLLLKDSDPEKASYIATSMLKNVGASLYRAIKGTIDGSIRYGAAEALGIKEGAIAVAENENYTKLISAAVRNQIKDIEKKIVAGKITVDTAMGK
jgi:basic membrane protein A and related proteins